MAENTDARDFERHNRSDSIYQEEREEEEEYEEEYEEDQPEEHEDVEKHAADSSPQGEAPSKGDTARLSYDYARSSIAGSRRRVPLTRHDSALTTLSRVSHVSSKRQGSAREPFTHPMEKHPTGPNVLVGWDGKDDPYRPLNWPFRKKCATTALYGFTTFGISFASSVYSAGIGQIASDFEVSKATATSGISMMLFGFGLGPLIWAPLSEVYGRKAAVLTPYFISAVFSFATGAAKDIQTVLLCRFFGGFFGSAPITNTGGVLGDIWAPEQRGVAIVAYAMAVIGGPTLGPIVGGAIVSSYLRWRWTEYLTGIVMMALLVLDVFLLDESFGPVLLVYKARRLRHESGNWALHARHEEWDVSLRDLAHKYLVRPFQMLCTPICFLIAVYASFVYGIVYANLSSFPIEFQQIRGWGQVVGALPFLTLLIGILFAAIVNLWNQKYYFQKFTANSNRAVPEARLPPMMLGSIVFAAGLFIFAWTSSPSIFWFPSQIGCALIGFGYFTIFQAALNYLVDTFQRYGASAIAANTFLRSMFAGAFPLFITPMYDALGVDWGTSVFAFCAVAAIPIPYLFFVFGRRIRARGVWSRDSL